MTKDREAGNMPEDGRIQDFRGRLEELATAYLVDTQSRLTSGDDLVQNTIGGLQFFGDEPTSTVVTTTILAQMVNRPETVEKMGEHFPAFRSASHEIFNMVAMLTSAASEPEVAGKILDRFTLQARRIAEGLATQDPKVKYETEIFVESSQTFRKLFYEISPLVESAMTRR